MENLNDFCFYLLKGIPPYEGASVKIYGLLPESQPLHFLKGICGDFSGACIEQFVGLFGLSTFDINIRLMGENALAVFLLRDRNIVVDLSGPEIGYHLDDGQILAAKKVAYAMCDHVKFLEAPHVWDNMEYIHLFKRSGEERIDLTGLVGQYYLIEPVSAYTWAPKSISDILSKLKPTRPVQFCSGKLRLRMQDAYHRERLWPGFGWGGKCHLGDDLFYLFATERQSFDQPFESIFVRDLDPPENRGLPVAGALIGDVLELRDIP